MPVRFHQHGPPSAQDAAIARVSSRVLARHARQGQRLTLHVQGNEDEHVELPAGAVSMLADLLAVMAAGQGLTLLPEHEELTTNQAAEVLHVSRPYLVKLLDDGVIPHRKIGKHRRVRVADLLDFKERDDREREAILDQLVRESQEQDMGYRRS